MSKSRRAADGLWWMRTLVANVAFVGSREGWVLVDAGVAGYGDAIISAACALFGADRARSRGGDGCIPQPWPDDASSAQGARGRRCAMKPE